MKRKHSAFLAESRYLHAVPPRLAGMADGPWVLLRGRQDQLMILARTG